MFSYKSTSYEKVEKPKPNKKFKQNSYEKIQKIVEDGGDMKLKETIKTITKTKKEKRLCQCGSMVSEFEKSRHLKSQKHQTYLKQQGEI